MEVSSLYVNDILIPIGTQPKGLEDIKMSFNRDTIYSGIDKTIDVDLVFYCDSGKEAIDEEYETKGIHDNGYINLYDKCGEKEIEVQFQLDFKKYRSDINSTSIGLIERNDTLDFKETIKNPVTIDDSLEINIQVGNHIVHLSM